MSWDFIRETLEKMNYPQQFIDWTIGCIASPNFFVLVNGSPIGFFSSTRGLRQGNPTSPLLFCLAMEVYSSLIPKCKGTRLSRLIFVDDLMIFLKADRESFEAINRKLNYFFEIFGFHVNKEKSMQIYVCRSNNRID